MSSEKMVRRLYVLRDPSGWEEDNCGERITCRSWKNYPKKKGFLVVTDDPETAVECAGCGIPCIGLQHPGDSSWFPAVRLVYSSVSRIDPAETERYYRRFMGMPVIIAVSDRLILREMRDTDYENWKKLVSEMDLSVNEVDFSSFKGYIDTEYEFYGFGYWAAVLKEEGPEGSMIGLCGCKEIPDADTGNCLEFGYAVRKELRGIGLGEEMCRAALKHVRDTWPDRQICVRIPKENRASRNLAVKLGLEGDNKDDGII